MHVGVDPAVVTAIPSVKRTSIHIQTQFSE